MKSLVQVCVLTMLFAMTLSCSDVKFRSDKNNAATATACSGTDCPAGTYSWFQGGYGICSKACGGGEQTQTVECRRNSDNVAVGDSLCTDPRPVATQTCNAQTCAGTYNWNSGPYGACTVTCGGGQRTRQVICQDQTGATVADTQCGSTTKPGVSESCNTNVCESFTYSWSVTAGACSKQCGGGTATDVVVCKRSDGTTVADTNCTGTKPATSRTCNPDACPVTYSYAWETGVWSVCSKDCGAGTQTRTAVCKRSDGAYVPENYCTTAKPATSQACQTKVCPVGRKVTQTATVTPALNAVDVIMIVDDSSSMKNDQTKLATRMFGLLTDLDALNIDYQVCLTTTDISYYKGAPIKWKGPDTVILTKNTPNRNQVFLNTIDALGAEWSSDEQGIKAQYLMIRDFRSSGCLRTDSTLTTILISDENERSVGGNQSWSSAQYQPLTPENYPDALISLVKTTFGTTKPFIWNSIIVKPDDKTCEAKQDAEGSPSFFGTMYAELSNKTGGQIGSICDTDYAANLQLIKQRVVNSMPGLTMECTPIDTPVVTFDRGVNTTISVTGNVIKFSPALSEGVKITAVYTCAN